MRRKCKTDGLNRRRGETVKKLLRRFADTPIRRLVIACILAILPSAVFAAEERVDLQALINEALLGNHEIHVAEARWKAATFKVPQAESLPDPMVMVGYQNEGWNNYTFGKMEGAQWMYSVSQMFPFPGKRSIKGEMAARDAQSAEAMYHQARLAAVSRVKELYYDLFLAYKDIDLIQDKTDLFSRIEEAALARYSTGMAPQQEALMAQTEKYMLLEREEMLKQKRLSLEAMLNATLGRDKFRPLGRPSEPNIASYSPDLDSLIQQAAANSPELKSKEKMAEASRSGVNMAEKEYYPDVTLTGNVFKRSGEFEDMWSVTATFNIPLYYRSRQSQALAEAKAKVVGAVMDAETAKVMLSSGIRDNYAMVKSSERLMELYRQGLIPKARQDVELAITGYRTGKIEAITAVSRLKSLLDFETQYWSQAVEHEKAIARIEALVGTEQSVGSR